MSTATKEALQVFTLPKPQSVDSDEECSIESCTDGTFVILRHPNQRPIFVGSREECEDWLLL